jgi:putative colanic acid biosynthesis acetyltransferase WcaF
MALITKPIHIEPGVWITSRCIILGGAHIGRSALVAPMSIVAGRVAPNVIVSGPQATVLGLRFPERQDQITTPDSSNAS